MRPKHSILVTTTPTMEGWQIDSYLGTISVNVVAGTGWLWDTFARFSDIFGRRSGVYQDQLASIDADAIDRLKEKAIYAGANMIVGLSLDHNQISGKEKQMFMVSALGTAVKASRLDGTSPEHSSETRTVEANELSQQMQRKSMADAAAAGKLELDDETLVFAISNQIDEIAPYVINGIRSGLIDHHKRDIITQYFRSLSEDVVKEHLYGALLDGREAVYSYIIEFIQENALLDFNYIDKLLDSDNPLSQKAALRLMKSHKSNYTHEDVDHLLLLSKKIESIFPVRVKYIEEKSKLSSNLKRKWICECGYKNNEDLSHCRYCKKDIYGLTVSGDNPIEITDLITKRAEALRELLQIT